MPKRALVLAGGGARGSYQVGMLDYLVNDRGLDFDVLRGVSVGALNTAFLAQAQRGAGPPASLANLRQQVAALKSLWTNEITGDHSVYGERAGGLAGLAVGADSLYTTDPLWHLIQKHVDVQALQTSGRDFRVGTVSLVSGHYGEWQPSDTHFLRRVLASASIPVVFPFVPFDDDRDVLVDGGVRNITPLSSAFRAEPDEVYVLLTSRLIRDHDDELPDSAVETNTYEQWDDNWLGTKVGGFDVLKRTVDILTDEIYLDDLRGALRWNAVAQGVEAVHDAVAQFGAPPEVRAAVDAVVATMKGAAKRRVGLYVLAPREWFGDDNSSTDFSPTLIAGAIQHGRDVAAAQSLWAWPPAVAP